MWALPMTKLILWTNPHPQPFNDYERKFMRVKDNPIRLSFVKFI